MPPVIRLATPDEIIPWLDSLSTTFLDRPDIATVATQVAPRWDFSRLWGAFDDGVVGTLRTWATELTVPGGGLVPSTAVSAVTVLPTHRRRGILRSMIAAEHAAARERGEVVGLLYASEAPIYGRFGYGTGVTTCTWTLDTRATGFVGRPATGVDFAPLDAATAGLMRSVFDDARRRQVGQIRRRDFTFDLDIGLLEFAWEPKWKGWVIVHRDQSGAPDGYARYSAEGKWEQHQPRSIVTIQDLVALDEVAYDNLWRFLADLDLVATIRAEGRSPAERLPWLLANRRAAVQTESGDALWVALLDARAALVARTYERTGDLVIEVIDAEPSTGRSRLRLEAGPDGAACGPTTRSADLTLNADALGAAYLGGMSLRLAALARGFEEHRPGALAEADALFRTIETPYCSTFF